LFDTLFAGDGDISAGDITITGETARLSAQRGQPKRDPGLRSTRTPGNVEQVEDML
jgi:hypothetical protein